MAVIPSARSENKLAHWTADGLVAGQVYINDWWVVETPFGGAKRSGYGWEKGQKTCGYSILANPAGVDDAMLLKVRYSPFPFRIETRTPRKEKIWLDLPQLRRNLPDRISNHCHVLPNGQAVTLLD